MKIVTIIPARGGSKEIPKKNIVSLCGKPLLWYVAQASQNSLSEETWVSTDCKEIKLAALDCGCQVIDRPQELCGDKSKSDEALVHFSEHVEFDILVFVQATSPLLQSRDIDKGIKMILNEGYDSVFAAARESWLPRWTLDVKPSLWQINNRPMRQDVEDKYLESGALYITTREQLEHSKLRYGGKIGVVEIPSYRNLDINSRDDLTLVEGFIKKRENHEVLPLF
tara:strand:- start:5252 stop:5926 length:675 start_codon:yes stop_codon:yes gene_type:complete